MRAAIPIESDIEVPAQCLDVFRSKRGHDDSPAVAEERCIARETSDLGFEHLIQFIEQRPVLEMIREECDSTQSWCSPQVGGKSGETVVGQMVAREQQLGEPRVVSHRADECVAAVMRQMVAAERKCMQGAQRTPQPSESFEPDVLQPGHVEIENAESRRSFHQGGVELSYRSRVGEIVAPQVQMHDGCVLTKRFEQVGEKLLAQAVLAEVQLLAAGRCAQKLGEQLGSVESTLVLNLDEAQCPAQIERLELRAVPQLEHQRRELVVGDVNSPDVQIAERRQMQLHKTVDLRPRRLQRS